MDNRILLEIASKLMEIAEYTIDIETQEEINELVEKIIDYLN